MQGTAIIWREDLITGERAYVSSLRDPGMGLDWGYTLRREEALPLARIDVRRFQADMREIRKRVEVIYRVVPCPPFRKIFRRELSARKAHDLAMTAGFTKSAVVQNGKTFVLLIG